MKFITGHNFVNNGPNYRITDSGCWEWLKAKWDGYGSAWKDGRKIKAHRLYYETFKGPIPEGLQIDHLCRNHSCVNPDHLEAVSHSENVRRGTSAKLTPDQVRQIKKIGKSKTLKVIGLEYGVHLSTISDILNGVIWADITP